MKRPAVEEFEAAAKSTAPGVHVPINDEGMVTTREDAAMTPERALALIAAREWRINSARASRWAAAGDAYSECLVALAGRAPVIGGESELSRSLRATISDVEDGLRRDAAARLAVCAANVVDALADRPCEVARWNMTTRGQRLPLP